MNEPFKSSCTVAAAGSAFVAAFVAKCLSKRLEDAAKDITGAGRGLCQLGGEGGGAPSNRGKLGRDFAAVKRRQK